eukprot:TRINITY_DN22782_c0_g1_i1.p1 TRINITY_DN22782_c0_g1~~TRINITY_DN22782_c0_g1_i1.p1  ORF type:complete len:291 (+),score=53.08 TRINITY_DN22782_c0_g1_i1:89-874(+)
MAALHGPPDAGLLSKLQYSCPLCGTSCGTAVSLIEHINGSKHKKATAAAGSVEDSDIFAQLEACVQLEATHREQGKATKPTFQERIKAWKEWRATASPEEVKAHDEEKKRKKQGEGPAPAKKTKMANAEPYACQCCGLSMTPSTIFGHITGKKHVKKAKQFENGCWLCALVQCQDSHFQGKQHLKAIALLESCGVDVESAFAVYEQEAAAEVQTQQATMQPAWAPAIQPATMRTKEADDLICWSFRKGNCKLGQACKWQHC